MRAVKGGAVSKRLPFLPQPARCAAKLDSAGVTCELYLGHVGVHQRWRHHWWNNLEFSDA